MLDTSQDKERITARVPPHIKETLQRAADLSGATLNQFIVQAALKEAQQVLEAERVIQLSVEDAAQVFRLIENPPAPTNPLTIAAQRHQDFFGESH